MTRVNLQPEYNGSQLKADSDRAITLVLREVAGGFKLAAGCTMLTEQLNVSESVTEQQHLAALLQLSLSL